MHRAGKHPNMLLLWSTNTDISDGCMCTHGFIHYLQLLYTDLIMLCCTITPVLCRLQGFWCCWVWERDWLDTKYGQPKGRWGVSGVCQENSACSYIATACGHQRTLHNQSTCRPCDLYSMSNMPNIYVLLMYVLMNPVNAYLNDCVIAS